MGAHAHKDYLPISAIYGPIAAKATRHVDLVMRCPYQVFHIYIPLEVGFLWTGGFSPQSYVGKFILVLKGLGPICNTLISASSVVPNAGETVPLGLFRSQCHNRYCTCRISLPKSGD